MHLTEASRPALVLHGGAGSTTVAPLVAHLAADHDVVAPTHPGWGGTERPDDLRSIRDLAGRYLSDLATRDLRDVLVVGSSIGGWIAVEMAAADVDGRIGALVLLDAVGIDVPGEELADVFALSPAEASALSFHDPERFGIDPAAMAPEQRAQQQAGMASLRALAGDPYMHDPTLRDRLEAVRVPALVLWGEEDGIARPAYGRAFAGLLPDARFAVLPEAGHFPQLERPDLVAAELDAFLNARA